MLNKFLDSSLKFRGDEGFTSLYATDKVYSTVFSAGSVVGPSDLHFDIVSYIYTPRWKATGSPRTTPNRIKVAFHRAVDRRYSTNMTDLGP